MHLEIMDLKARQGRRAPVVCKAHREYRVQWVIVACPVIRGHLA